MAAHSAAMGRARLTAATMCIRRWSLRHVSSCVAAWSDAASRRRAVQAVCVRTVHRLRRLRVSIAFVTWAERSEEEREQRLGHARDVAMSADHTAAMDQVRAEGAAAIEREESAHAEAVAALEVQMRSMAESEVALSEQHTAAAEVSKEAAAQAAVEAAEERGRLQEAMQAAEQEHAQAIGSMRAEFGASLQEMVDSEEATMAAHSAAMGRARLTAHSQELHTLRHRHQSAILVCKRQAEAETEQRRAKDAERVQMLQMNFEAQLAHTRRAHAERVELLESELHRRQAARERETLVLRAANSTTATQLQQLESANQHAESVAKTQLLEVYRLEQANLVMSSERDTLKASVERLQSQAQELVTIGNADRPNAADNQDSKKQTGGIAPELETELERAVMRIAGTLDKGQLEPELAYKQEIRDMAQQLEHSLLQLEQSEEQRNQLQAQLERLSADNLLRYQFEQLSPNPVSTVASAVESPPGSTFVPGKPAAVFQLPVSIQHAIANTNAATKLASASALSAGGALGRTLVPESTRAISSVR